MNGVQLSKFLDEVSKPKHPLYYPTQTVIISASSYTGTAILNATWIISTPPSHGMAFVVLAFTSYAVVTPIFTHLLKPYSAEKLALWAHDFLKCTSAVLISKLICALFSMSLKLSQIFWITIGFFVVYRVMRTVLEKFRESLSPAPISVMPMKSERKQI